MRLKTCDNCGNEFVYHGRHGTRNRHFFCCYDCYIAFKTKKVKVTCELCGTEFMKKRSDIERTDHNFCSEKCYRDYMSLNRDSIEGLHYDGKPIYRLLVEHELGRILFPDEMVHHIDGNHKNNALSNLMVVSQSEHQRIHAANKPRNHKGQFIRREGAPNGQE